MSSHQLVLKSIARGSTARGDTQLAVDAAQMRVDGMQTQHQVLRRSARQSIPWPAGAALRLHAAVRLCRDRVVLAFVGGVGAVLGVAEAA